MKSKKKPKKSYKRHYSIGTAIVLLALAGFITQNNLSSEAKKPISTVSASAAKPFAKKVSQKASENKLTAEENENTHTVKTRVQMFQPTNTTK